MKNQKFKAGDAVVFINPRTNKFAIDTIIFSGNITIEKQTKFVIICQFFGSGLENIKLQKFNPAKNYDKFFKI